MNWLSKLIFPTSQPTVPEEVSLKLDPTQENIGIHLLSDYASEYEFVSEEISESCVVDLINNLEWENGFFQVTVTLEPGLFMEVGGSLNGIDGLAGVYHNHPEKIMLVTSIPPENRDEMVEIILSFIRKNGEWKDKYQFD